MAHSWLVPTRACFVKRKLRHRLIDSLVRVTVPEGGVRTRGSRACTLLCIPPHTLSQDSGSMCWHSQAPPRGLSTAPGPVWHSSPFLPTAQPQALQSKPQCAQSDPVNTFLCLTLAGFESARLSVVQPCSLLQPAPAILHGHPQVGHIPARV